MDRCLCHRAAPRLTQPEVQGSKAGKVDVTFEALAANDDGAPTPAQPTSTSADDAEARIREPGRELEAQLRIRELEAQLAAATMGQPAASPSAQTGEEGMCACNHACVVF